MTHTLPFSGIKISIKVLRTFCSIQYKFQLYQVGQVAMHALLCLGNRNEELFLFNKTDDTVISKNRSTRFQEIHVVNTFYGQNMISNIIC